MRHFFLFFAALLSLSFPAKAADPNFSSAQPAKKTRIVIVENSKVTKHFLPQPNEIPSMVERGLTKFTGKNNSTLAWQSLISSNDVVGIKVVSEPGRTIGTRPEVVS